MTERTVETIDLDGFTATLVEQFDDEGIRTVGWELSCHECEYVGWRLSRGQVDAEIVAHEHVESLSEYEARRIIADHQAGLHDGETHPSIPDACGHPRCIDAWWLVTCVDDPDIRQ